MDCTDEQKQNSEQDVCRTTNSGVSLSSWYPYYALALLWLVALFRFVDLQILAVLLEPIKAEFSFSDAQLALLGGLAFAFLYGCLGIPIAWAADRFNRKNIIASAVGIWSLMTALCGFASGFASLFLARMGVGIGEAGAYPPTTSLLSDYFPEQQHGRVFSVLASAIPLGVCVGFMVGGIVNQYYGWRVAFQLVGIPGIILAILVHLTLKELPRGYAERRYFTPSKESFRTTLSILWQIPSYRHIVIGACLFTLGAYGSGLWIPSYFIRHHGLSSAEVGIWMAVLYGGGGLIGSLAGGSLAQYLSIKYDDYSWYMRICSFSLLATLPLTPIVFLTSNTYLALACHFFICLLMHVNIGPVLAMIQTLAGCQRRAMAQAISVLVTNIIALPLGPLIVGISSDLLTPQFGTQALGAVIVVLMILAYGAAAFYFMLAAQTLTSADL